MLCCGPRQCAGSLPRAEHVRSAANQRCRRRAQVRDSPGNVCGRDPATETRWPLRLARISHIRSWRARRGAVRMRSGPSGGEGAATTVSSRHEGAARVRASVSAAAAEWVCKMPARPLPLPDAAHGRNRDAQVRWTAYGKGIARLASLQRAPHRSARPRACRSCSAGCAAMCAQFSCWSARCWWSSAGGSAV